MSNPISSYFAKQVDRFFSSKEPEDILMTEIKDVKKNLVDTLSDKLGSSIESTVLDVQSKIQEFNTKLDAICKDRADNAYFTKELQSPKALKTLFAEQIDKEMAKTELRVGDKELKNDLIITQNKDVYAQSVVENRGAFEGVYSDLNILDAFSLPQISHTSKGGSALDIRNELVDAYELVRKNLTQNSTEDGVTVHSLSRDLASMKRQAKSGLKDGELEIHKQIELTHKELELNNAYLAKQKELHKVLDNALGVESADCFGKSLIQKLNAVQNLIQVQQGEITKLRKNITALESKKEEVLKLDSLTNSADIQLYFEMRLNAHLKSEENDLENAFARSASLLNQGQLETLESAKPLLHKGPSTPEAVRRETTEKDIYYRNDIKQDRLMANLLEAEQNLEEFKAEKKRIAAQITEIYQSYEKVSQSVDAFLGEVRSGSVTFGEDLAKVSNALKAFDLDNTKLHPQFLNNITGKLAQAKAELVARGLFELNEENSLLNLEESNLEKAKAAKNSLLAKKEQVKVLSESAKKEASRALQMQSTDLQSKLGKANEELNDLLDQPEFLPADSDTSLFKKAQNKILGKSFKDAKALLIESKNQEIALIKRAQKVVSVAIVESSNNAGTLLASKNAPLDKLLEDKEAVISDIQNRVDLRARYVTKLKAQLNDVTVDLNHANASLKEKLSELPAFETVGINNPSIQRWVNEQARLAGVLNAYASLEPQDAFEDALEEKLTGKAAVDAYVKGKVSAKIEEAIAALVRSDEPLSSELIVSTALNKLNIFERYSDNEIAQFIAKAVSRLEEAYGVDKTLESKHQETLKLKERVELAITEVKADESKSILAGENVSGQTKLLMMIQDLKLKVVANIETLNALVKERAVHLLALQECDKRQKTSNSDDLKEARKVLESKAQGIDEKIVVADAEQNKFARTVKDLSGIKANTPQELVQLIDEDLKSRGAALESLVALRDEKEGLQLKVLELAKAAEALEISLDERKKKEKKAVKKAFEIFGFSI
ncbi:MAG: hypothetical protein S4CHLAM7_04000 [Chlamydiae bacterium]|nr:hypothetical protein [Chlamydiota bacterium]